MINLFNILINSYFVTGIIVGLVSTFFFLLIYKFVAFKKLTVLHFLLFILSIFSWYYVVLLWGLVILNFVIALIKILIQDFIGLFN